MRMQFMRSTPVGSSGSFLKMPSIGFARYLASRYRNLLRKRKSRSVKNEVLALVFHTALNLLHLTYQNLAAQRSQSAASSSKSYVLTSILTVAYCVPLIYVPACIPSDAVEESFTGFYTFIVSIMSLSPRGMIMECILERYLKRIHEDNYVLNDEKTEGSQLCGVRRLRC